MAKFSGKLGYVATIETTPGVWTNKSVERQCYGDILRNTKRVETSGKVNNDIYLNSQISVVADPYARINFRNIAYVLWNGIKWKVTSVDPRQFPRIVLEIGGLYHENETGTSY